MMWPWWVQGPVEHRQQKRWKRKVGTTYYWMRALSRGINPVEGCSPSGCWRSSILTPPIERELRGYRIHSLGGSEVESRFPSKGAVVERSDFDRYLISRLEEPPVNCRVRRLKNNSNFIALKGEKNFNARVVIACDGASSRMRKSLAIGYPLLAPAFQYVYSLDQDEIESRIGGWFEVFYYFSRGYGWVSPLRGKLKVGVGGTGGYFSRGVLDRFVNHPPVRERLRGAELLAYESRPIPMGGPARKLAKGRALLAGDAGGFVYPGTGEGIYYGMKSGIEAARAASLYLQGGESSLEEWYLRCLESSGLLSLREVDFLDSVLASPESAESYIARLARMQR